jgi:hypothetical protein
MAAALLPRAPAIAEVSRRDTAALPPADFVNKLVPGNC